MINKIFGQMDWLKKIDWTAWLATILLIVVFRESALWLMTQLDYPELGNLIGLLSLLVILIIWRKLGRIPLRLVDTTNRLMKESAFAFLPVSAGSLIMLLHMGEKIPTFLAILLISTLIPLWVYAQIAKRWL